MEFFRCDIPRLNITFELTQCKIKDILNSLIILRTDDRVYSSKKGFIRM